MSLVRGVLVLVRFQQPIANLRSSPKSFCLPSEIFGPPCPPIRRSISSKTLGESMKASTPAESMLILRISSVTIYTVSYTHLRAHETPEHLVCRLLLEKKNKLED